MKLGIYDCTYTINDSVLIVTYHLHLNGVKVFSGSVHDVIEYESDNPDGPPLPTVQYNKGDWI